MCGWICGYCLWLIEGHPLRSAGPVNGRSPMTEMVLQLKKGAMDLKPGDLVLVKADAFMGKGKIKDRWEDKPCKVVHQIATEVPSYKVMDQCRQSQILHCNRLLLVTSETGVSLCVGVCHEWLPQLPTELSHGYKTIGGMEWVTTPPCQVFWQLVIIYLDMEYFHSVEKGPCHQHQGVYIPLILEQGTMKNHRLTY